MSRLTLLLGMVLTVGAPHPTPSAPQTPSWRGPSFRGLGDLPGGKYISLALDVSMNGVVVGNSKSEKGDEAFRWTAEGGLQGLGDLPNGHFMSQAYAVSSDGTRIVGFGSPPCSKYPACTQAFVWTEAQGMKGLGNLSGREGAGAALAVSADGRVIVGYGFDENIFDNAVMWTPGANPVRLFESARTKPDSKAHDVSENGLVVVGHMTKSGKKEAFRWTAEDGVVGIGAPPGGFSSMAAAVSGDGSVIVGSFWGTSTSGRAFRWTGQGGMVELADLPGGISEGNASDISADGTLIIGSGFGQERIRSAVIWDREEKPRRIVDVLREKGLQRELEGWTLLQATAISPDGRFVVGDGENPKGQREGWVASLR